jgi:nitric oxide reductase subunit C
MTKKQLLLLILLATFTGYSLLVYTSGTETQPGKIISENVKNGKRLWQEKNCSACHQLFGLGGYLGPELTNCMSDPAKNENYFRAIMKSGTQRMPDFGFSDHEVADLVSFLRYVDENSGQYYRRKSLTAGK